MATQRRSKTMPTEGQATKFLYAILKQLDLKTIDWSLVATELEISNGHAARMRYSRFRQQMEGTATTAAPRTVKLKKAANGKTDSSKVSSAKSAKGKLAYDKSSKGSSSTKGSSSNKCDVAADGNNKNRSVLEGSPNQETMNYGVVMPVDRDEPMPDYHATIDPFANGLPYCSPLNRSAFSSEVGFPWVPVQQSLQRQPPVFDPSTNFLLAPDETMLSPAIAPDSYDTSWPFSNNYDTFTNPHGTAAHWKNHTEICFSGCCQPPRSSTPGLFPSYPLENAGFPLISESEPMTPELSHRPQPSENVWVPIKPEPGCEESSDDILVKIEPDADTWK